MAPWASHLLPVSDWDTPEPGPHPLPGVNCKDPALSGSLAWRRRRGLGAAFERESGVLPRRGRQSPEPTEVPSSGASAAPKSGLLRMCLCWGLRGLSEHSGPPTCFSGTLANTLHQPHSTHTHFWGAFLSQGLLWGGGHRGEQIPTRPLPQGAQGSAGKTGVDQIMDSGL